MRFYHLTQAMLIPAILKMGLLPRRGKLTKLANDVKAVYLFKTSDDMEQAILNWLGEAMENEFGEDIELATVCVDIPNEKLGSFHMKDNSFEVQCYDVIPSCYIHVIQAHL